MLRRPDWSVEDWESNLRWRSSADYRSEWTAAECAAAAVAAAAPASIERDYTDMRSHCILQLPTHSAASGGRPGMHLVTALLLRPAGIAADRGSTAANAAAHTDPESPHSVRVDGIDCRGRGSLVMAVGEEIVELVATAEGTGPGCNMP